ncbi:protein LphB [Legionella taurinensis]|uniref:Protein LphB n=1 Tax=Legionella taurinensis TaxID=70611 RepID=A0AB38NAN2_9GAMM|nr:protein LphB [Legionella taurinensis]MDX1836720.1 protein LphB [Legionella taurinensis]PUT42826.1 protein LphB [Legionella taurinensis]PUT45381.1 protein LphB [Legionella taurinensis]PUT47044.1 protein LphB [Legionella taurinensis]PUT49148.1 protein LphB [Legionella taurinensis]
MKVKKTAWLVFLLLVFIYLFILQIKAIWPFTIDDMYITLRYARHWALEGQLLWNIGEPPVEGYSNFSFLILAAYVLRWGGDPVFALKLTGVLGLLFTLLAVYRLSRLWFDRGLSLIPCFWLLWYRGQIIWSVGGLETTTYQALLALGLYCLLRTMGYPCAAEPRKAGQWPMAVLAALLFTLASMTRPEAPVLIILFYSLACWDVITRQRSALMALIVSVLTYLMAFSPYFIWRWHYYGLLFPNPVYCKAHSSEWFVLCREYLSLAWPFLLLALYAAIRERGKELPWYFLLPSAVYMLLLVRADSIVAFDTRLFLPAFALLLPLSLQGIKALLSRFLLGADPSVFRVAMVMASFLMAFFFIPAMTLPQLRYFTQNPIAGEQLRMKVIAWLARHMTENSRVVLGDSGFIPYRSRLRFIDSFCLNNKAMALQPRTERDQWFCKTILLLKPDVVILSSLRENNTIHYLPVDHCLQKALTTNRNYQLKALFYTVANQQSYRYEIFQLSGGEARSLIPR